VSLPAIAGNLGASANQGTWIITSFGVANAISVPLTGWLTQRVGAVRLFTASVLLFVLTSWLCGFAPDAGVADLLPHPAGSRGRSDDPAVAGALLSTVPKDEVRNGALHVVDDDAGRAGGRAVAGRLDHRQLLVAVDLLHQHARRHPRRGRDLGIYRHAERRLASCPIDSIGLGLLVLWVGALQLLLDQGKELDWFNSSVDRRAGRGAPSSASRCSSSGSSRRSIPIVDLRLLRGRNFGFGVATLSLPGSSTSAMSCCCRCGCSSTWATRATCRGLRARAGRRAGGPAGALHRAHLAAVDPRWISTVSFVIFAGVLLVRAQYTPQVDQWSIMIPTLVLGAASRACSRRWWPSSSPA
jgi:DHA2 family multidrug resistance protein